MAILSKNEIKLLVEKSSLLTDAEKSEWTSLLPLMNDKQVNDLMSILSSGGTSKPVASVSASQPSVLPSTNKQPNMVTSLGPMDESLTKRDPRVADSGRSQITLGAGISQGFPVVPVKGPAAAPKQQPVMPVVAATKSQSPVIQSPVQQQKPQEKPAPVSKPVSTEKPLPASNDKANLVLPHNAQTLLQLDLFQMSEEQYNQLGHSLVSLKDAWGYENFATLFRQSPFYKKYVGSVSDLLSGKPSAFTEDLLNKIMDLMLILRK